MDKLDYLLKQHETFIGWYKQSEEKAKFLVTLNTLIVSVVNGLVFIGIDKVKAIRSLYLAPIWSLIALSGISLIGSYFFILRAVWSRHHKRITSVQNFDGICFFGDIASMDQQKYQNLIDNWTSEELERTMVKSNYILSNNVLIKHEALNWAIALTIIDLILLFDLGVVYGISSTSSVAS